ncbi:cell division protein FtsQ/DivIB [Nocardioides sp.]|uniref:cell division protein FtsQ/DivIB n=1 Tax=Nocardioides sp. TaxID=35761 RepID=UPI002729161B|nr:FtsQ-type POTRA domain-containing protein [Nocardioides sp.]MDO9455911.1 FtsQ-type POTRA domain-containing protein [Nocardioides sp.]
MARTRRSTEERSRRRFARRQWARRWLTLRYLVVAAVVLVLGGGGLYAVYFSDALSVSDVEVVGARTISAADVESAADVPTGGPLATVDLDAIEFRVRSLKAVRSVEVTRQWPDSVLITIQEREPVAVVRLGADLQGVDVEGVPFRTYQRPPSGLPRIETPDGTSATDEDALKEAVTVIAALPREVSVLVDHLDLRSIDEIDLVLRDDRVVRWGSADASAEKAKVLIALLRQPGKVLDVSVPGQPTTSD